MTPFEEEMVAQVSATRLAHRGVTAALFLAMNEAKVLDIERVLSFVDTLAAGLRQPVGLTNPERGRVLTLAAEEMDELRPAILKMVTIQPGAGRA